jgi:hypothetical protein
VGGGGLSWRFVEDEMQALRIASASPFRSAGDRGNKRGFPAEAAVPDGPMRYCDGGESETDPGAGSRTGSCIVS